VRGLKGLQEVSRSQELHAEQDWAGLIARVAEQDQTALATFYDATRRLVYGMSYRILGDREAAEEVTLDIYLQVWRQAARFDLARGNPSAWLYTLARSRSIDRLRRQRFERNIEEPIEAASGLPCGGPTPDEDSLSSDRRRRIEEAMQKLSPEQREAITVAYFSGLSHTEIAEKLGQPLGTVKTRIRLGMMKLRELLEPLGEKA
jgi:RNA polymerase sigma-70 factor (ECF subfamily)